MSKRTKASARQLEGIRFSWDVFGIAPPQQHRGALNQHIAEAEAIEAARMRRALGLAPASTRGLPSRVRLKAVLETIDEQTAELRRIAPQARNSPKTESLFKDALKALAGTIDRWLREVRKLAPAERAAFAQDQVRLAARRHGLLEVLAEDDDSSGDDLQESGALETGSRVEALLEASTLAGGELDAPNFVARGVTLIRPGFSTNRDSAGRQRYYSAQTLKAAAPNFNEARAFRNHPRRSDDKDLPERDVRDITGYYKNVKAHDDGRLVGDLHVVGEAREWLWPLIVEAVTNKPDLIALSINALGTMKAGMAEGKKAMIVESIDEVRSVDVVTTGAAGGGFAGALLHSARRA